MSENEQSITREDLMEKTKTELVQFAQLQGLEVKGHATKSKGDIASELLAHMGDGDNDDADPEDYTDYEPPAPPAPQGGFVEDDLDYITDPALMRDLASREGLDFSDETTLEEMKAEIRAERAARDAATAEEVDEVIPDPNYQADQGRKPPMIESGGRIGPPQLLKMPLGPVIELGAPSGIADREVEYFVINGLNHIIKRGVPTQIPEYLLNFIDDNNQQAVFAENVDNISQADGDIHQRFGIAVWDSPKSLPKAKRQKMVPVRRITGNALRA